MKKKEIQDRIAELQNCLIEMPNHPNRVDIETDIRNLENRLEHKDYE
jgi:tetrahydromethanopterin S-methyltransferase subunit F